MSLIQSFQSHTPFTDKFMVIFGSAYTAIISVDGVNAGITVMVGLATFALLIARGIIAWRQVMGGKSKDKDDD